MVCSLPALLLGTFLAGVLLPGARAQTIHQWPPTEVQPTGSPLSLDCTVKGASSPNLYWYRQARVGAPQLLFFSISVDQVESQAPQHFTASRPQDGHFTLHSEKLFLNDSGLYLCAWSITLRWVGQTSVQKPHNPLHPHHPLQGPSLRDRVQGVLHCVAHCWSVSVGATESSQISPKNLRSSQEEQKNLCLQNQ